MPGSAADQDDEPLLAGPAAGPGQGASSASSADSGGQAPPVAPAAGGTGTVPRVALRPMTVADVLDGAFAVIKARPRKILTFTAAFVVPVQVVAAYVQRETDAGGVEAWLSDDPTLTGEASGGGGEVLAMALLLIVPSIALVCVAAGLAHLVTGWAVGRDASGREMLGVVGRRWWPLLGSFVVVHLAEAGGVLACYVGVFAVMALFVVVAPVVGAEGASAGGALRRSVRLVGPRYWVALLIVLLTGVVSLLLGLALASLPQGLALVIGLDNGWPLYALGGILSALVVTPFVAAASVLLYLDLRVRTEGLDLEIAARDVLDRAV